MAEAEYFSISNKLLSVYLDDIIGLNKEIFGSLFQNPYGKEKYKKMLNSPNPFIILARETSGAGGFGKTNLVGDLIAITKENSFYIWLCGTRGNWRNSGLTRNMLNVCEGEAKKRNLDSITSKTYNISNVMQGILIRRGYQIMDVEKNPEDSRYNSVNFKLFL